MSYVLVLSSCTLLLLSLVGYCVYLLIHLLYFSDCWNMEHFISLFICWDELIIIHSTA